MLVSPRRRAFSLVYSGRCLFGLTLRVCFAGLWDDGKIALTSIENERKSVGNRPGKGPKSMEMCAWNVFGARWDASCTKDGFRTHPPVRGTRLWDAFGSKSIAPRVDFGSQFGVKTDKIRCKNQRKIRGPKNMEK